MFPPVRPIYPQATRRARGRGPETHAPGDSRRPFPRARPHRTLAEIVAEEERVVAEAARPFRLLEYPTCARPFEHLGYRARVAKVDQHAAIPCPTPRLGGPAESSQQLGVVGGVYRLGRPLGAGPPARANAGRPPRAKTSSPESSATVGRPLFRAKYSALARALPGTTRRAPAGLPGEIGRFRHRPERRHRCPVGSRRRPISCCLPPLRVAARIFTCPGPSAAPGTTRRCRARPDRAARRAGRGRTCRAPPCPAPPRISPDRS